MNELEQEIKQARLDHSEALTNAAKKEGELNEILATKELECETLLVLKDQHEQQISELEAMKADLQSSMKALEQENLTVSLCYYPTFPLFITFH